MSGADQLLKTGVLRDVGWFSPEKGYGILEVESKAKVLELVSSYFPFYTQQIHEIPSWEKAKESFLSSARRAAKEA